MDDPPMGGTDMAAEAAPMMPPVQYADLPGLRMAYYEAGPRGGIPIVFCHGFPELAFSWRHQIKALSEAGRWVIAPDQRGYGLTDRPEAVEAYDLERLTGDMVALLDHLGVEKAIFCGHDWGGFVVWQMALRHRERVAGVIGLNTPHFDRSLADPIEIFRQRFGEEMYIVHFQKPGEADEILARSVENTIDLFMRRPLEMEGQVGGGLQGGGDSTFPLVKIVEAYQPGFDPREPFLTPQERSYFVDTFKATGFTGGINWYRNFSRNWRLSEGLDHHIAGLPCLMVMAEKDAVLPPAATEGMEDLIDDLEKALVEKSGHWTQQEEPEAVNRIILDWLQRRFPG
jgi:pimeloyl-ACP methyl ester carboxylesterase